MLDAAIYETKVNPVFSEIEDAISYTQFNGYNIKVWCSRGLLLRTYVICGNVESIEFFKQARGKHFNSSPENLTYIWFLLRSLVRRYVVKNRWFNKNNNANKEANYQPLSTSEKETYERYYGSNKDVDE